MMSPRLRLSRRNALRLAGLTSLSAWAAACRPMTQQPLNVAYPTPTLRPDDPVAPADAMERLLTGNGRYALDLHLNPGRTEPRRAQIATGQHPFAVIVTDSDSRVTPEVIFDQGLGDLFVVRVAGMVLDDEVIGSIEYAVEHLGVKAILVLGPERSGAVRAALESVVLHQPVLDELTPLVEGLRPAITAASHREGDAWENTINENTLRVAERLAATGPLLYDFVTIGELKIAAGRYDLDSGLITMLKRPVGYEAEAFEEESAEGHTSSHGTTEETTSTHEAVPEAQTTSAEPTAALDSHMESTPVEAGHAEATATPAAPDGGHGDLIPTATPEATH